MRWGIFFVRLVRITLSLFIAALVILSILPLAMGGLRVDTPQDEEGGVKLEGDILKMSLPIEISNGGYFSIEDLLFHYVVTDLQGETVAEDSSEPVTVEAGEDKRINVELEMNLNDFSPSHLRSLVFEGGQFNMLIEVNSYYTMRFFRFNLALNETIDFEPMINDYGIHTEGITHSYDSSAEAMTFFIPYYIYGSPMLEGQSLILRCAIFNSTSEIAEKETAIVFSVHNEQSMEVLIVGEAAQYLLTSSDLLTISFEVEFKGISDKKSFQYQWQGGQP